MYVNKMHDCKHNGFYAFIYLLDGDKSTFFPFNHEQTFHMKLKYVYE